MKPYTIDTINRAIQMLISFRAIEELRLLKNTLVKQQDYDNADKLRDIEDVIADRLNNDNYKIIDEFLSNL
jgi:hypothetical protein